MLLGLVPLAFRPATTFSRSGKLKVERSLYHQSVQIAQAWAPVLIPFHSTLPPSLCSKLWCLGTGHSTKEGLIHALTQTKWMSFFTIPSSSTYGINEEQLSKARIEFGQLRKTTCSRKAFVFAIMFPSPNSLVISKYSAIHRRTTTFVAFTW
jgi:hypothetical protein